jgi:hypothetical protein
MSDKSSPPLSRRPDIYAGVMFIVIAAGGLYLAKDYSMGTAVRMGTGYVPTLLCWTLLALGVAILVKALITGKSEAEPLGAENGAVLRPLLLVTAAVVVFALSIETLGLILSLAATILVGSFASRSIRPVEALVAMVLLTIVCWGVFGYALALPFPIWPRF